MSECDRVAACLQLAMASNAQEFKQQQERIAALYESGCEDE